MHEHECRPHVTRCASCRSMVVGGTGDIYVILVVYLFIFWLPPFELCEYKTNNSTAVALGVLNHATFSFLLAMFFSAFVVYFCRPNNIANSVQFFLNDVCRAIFFTLIFFVSFNYRLMYCAIAIALLQNNYRIFGVSSILLNICNVILSASLCTAHFLCPSLSVSFSRRCFLSVIIQCCFGCFKSVRFIVFIFIFYN